MKLNRHNYEEYFILYLDNELDSEGRHEVELFASEHPDLKAELDMLLQSKFTPDTDIVFNNKESLLVRDSSAISLNNHEEWLLLYIDNELSTEEIKNVEKFIAAHPEAKTELGLLQKTKLQPEAIVFPDKESLYRKEEKAKVVAFHWKRWAVAAALLIGISTTAIVLLNNKKQSGPIAKKTETKAPAGNNTNRQSQRTVPAEVEVLAITNDQKDGTPKKEAIDNTARIKKDNIAPQKKNDDILPVNNETPAIAQNDPENKRGGNNLPKPENNPNVNPVGISADMNNDLTAKITPKATLTNNNSDAGATPVTHDPSGTYNPQEHASDNKTDNPDAVFASNDGKKNKLRGFFRKITRTFEKRTNIKATDDEDDRLLIAGLAIKLN